MEEKSTGLQCVNNLPYGAFLQYSPKFPPLVLNLSAFVRWTNSFGAYFEIFQKMKGYKWTRECVGQNR